MDVLVGAWLADAESGVFVNVTWCGSFSGKSGPFAMEVRTPTPPGSSNHNLTRRFPTNYPPGSQSRTAITVCFLPWASNQHTAGLPDRIVELRDACVTGPNVHLTNLFVTLPRGNSGFGVCPRPAEVWERRHEEP
jgi:hypothetical protein